MGTSVTNWLLLVAGVCGVAGMVAYAYKSSTPTIKMEFSVPEHTIYIMDSERNIVGEGKAARRD